MTPCIKSQCLELILTLKSPFWSYCQKHMILEICQRLDSVMFDVAIDVASGVDSKHIWTNKYTLKTSQVLTLIYIQVC